ncbi:protein-tyrosine phosphatase family protein [Amycolatopsis jejuensis]|uniref:protein-tyrosine phosphatase family protein n=1 Tax=Amycolatopsis jejuensis TaxID=330084 RepID=UPI0005268BAF|nr:protein-tyrosine phosphatase family protein [Amycolatopsis jejuensis]
MDSALVGTLVLPDGAELRARGLGRPAPGGPDPEFGLYLGSRRMRAKYDAALTWEHRWIRWPDFLLPSDRDGARREIEGLHARAKAGEAVEVACYGGVGRTGTVLACLATLGGLPPDDAVAWVRENHHERAVETPWQRRWVRWFAEQARDR